MPNRLSSLKSNHPTSKIGKNHSKLI